MKSRVCVDDFEESAFQSLDRNALNYYKSGADEEVTLRENRTAFHEYKIFPRLLRDVSNIDLSTTILGQKVSMPICVAPTAMQRLAHNDGELATARACLEHDTLMGLSTLSTTSIETVAREVPDLKRWLQLYVYKDLKMTEKFVRRAEQAGFTAVAVTVDTPILGKRRADERFKFKLPDNLRLANFDQKDLPEVASSEKSGLSSYVDQIQNRSLNWEHIKWLRSVTKMKIVLKGILTAEDAQLAVEHGVDAIWVSNHGGRQLDTVPSTIYVLPSIVRAVQGSPVEVYLDGGVRAGTDVLKALALGAKAVFVGRPVLWGLATAGEEGVSEVLSILREELKLAMALSGCRNVSEIQPSLVKHVSQIAHI